MASLEDIAQTAIRGDALNLRSLIQEWLDETPRLNEVPMPPSSDPSVLAVSAGLVELFAQRRSQRPRRGRRGSMR